MSSAIVEVAGLVKHFDDVTAVKGIDFTIKSGELVGLPRPKRTARPRPSIC